MQPQQPYNNPYDFIMSPEKPQRTPLAGLSGGGMGMRIAVVAVGVIVLIIAFVMLSSLFSSSGNVPNMTVVAEDQNELQRVTNLALQDHSSDVTQQTTMNFAQTSSLSIATAQAQLLSFLSAHGAKVSTGKLGLKANPATDRALTAAAASSTFDQAYLTAMQTDLEAYASDIKVAFANSQNATEKQILSKDYNDEQLLMQQLTSAQSSVSGANS